MAYAKDAKKQTMTKRCSGTRGFYSDPYTIVGFGTLSILVDRLNHRFSKQQALCDVTLHVRSGDCYGFLGHNGAGKTTTMRVALGLLRPDSGRVIVDGFDIAEHPREARARMGGLIETPGFHGHLSGANNLRLLARLTGMAPATARSEAQRVLDLVGLGNVGSKPARAYSQGMRQRLGLAQALLGAPPYVLLDEPTNGLDPEGVAEMRALLRRLTRDEAMTILISSHQLHELADVCNRVGVLREGKVVVEGTLEQLLAEQRAQYALRTDRDDAARGVLEPMGVKVATEDGGLRLDIGAREPGDVARALVLGGLRIRTFAPHEPSLEEVYLRYTRDGGSGPPTDIPDIKDAEPGERLAARHAVWRMIRYEVHRWMGRLAVPAMIIAPAVLGVWAVLRRRAEVAEDAGKVAAGELASATEVTAFEGVGVALEAATPILPYILLGMASQSLAGEFSQGTLRNVLLRPLKRLHIMLGKGIALLGAAFCAYAVTVAAAFLAAAWAFDFTDLADILPAGKRFVFVYADELWSELRRALWTPLLPLSAYVGIGLLAGAVSRRGATGLALALCAGVGLDLSRAVARSYDAEGFLPSTHVSSPLGEGSYLDYSLDVARGYSDATFAWSDTHVVVPLLWLAGSFILAAVIFGRRYVP